jgi:hypothetical protein
VGSSQSPPDTSGPLIQKFHGDERIAVLVVNFVNGADVGVIQRGSGFRLALKAGECLRVFGYVVGEELEGNKATELDILSFVNHTHPTAAEFFDDAVVRDGFVDHEWAQDSGCNIRDATRQSQRGAQRYTQEAEIQRLQAIPSLANPPSQKGTIRSFILCGLSPPVSEGGVAGPHIYLRATEEI